MTDIWKNYVTHLPVQSLMLSLAACVYGIASLSLWASWPWLLLVVASAPFYEWVLHKYVLHRQLDDKPGFMRDYQIRLHHGHHLHPDDRALQFAPPSSLVIMFAQLYAFYALVTWSFATALMPLAGSLAYYLMYEWIHLAHHTKAYKPFFKFGVALREAHMRHHFHNENYNWGITNGIGDLVLGTWKSTQDVPKSQTIKNIAGYQETSQ